MKLLFFDLETTGTNPGRNGIHQISGSIVIDGKHIQDFDFHVQPNPKAIIEDEALKVAGVTREQILAYPPMGQVYSEFAATLGVQVDGDSLHNAMYDIELTKAVFDIVTDINV